MTELAQQANIVAKMFIETGGLSWANLLVKAVGGLFEPVIPDGRGLATLQAGAFGLCG